MKDIVLKIASKHDINIAALVNMINAVYRKSEDSIWKKEHHRISNPLLLDIINNNELLIAQNSDEILGCIHLEKVDAELYKFKMLAVSPNHKGTGVGSKLVRFAEKQAISYGAKIMQLELLVPTDFIHPDKVILHDWYSKIGYKEVATHNINYIHEGISQFLKTNCDAIVYQKPLI
jgi:ribosomal protein S18 acetylase RimI-like enzyme